MWEEFGLGLLVAFGCLAVLFVGCHLSPSPAGRMGWWYAPPSAACSAGSRAQALLQDILGEAHYQQVLSRGYLEVPSPSLAERVYRIPSTGGLVTVYEHGRAIMRLCLQPTEPLPEADVVIMHKLLIEANEQGYLHKANRLALK